MYKFLNSGRDIDPLDVLKEIAGILGHEGIRQGDNDALMNVINKIEIQRLNNA